MPMKQQTRKVYKTAQGKTIDMDMLRQKNELVPAVGNARVNARGDELGPGGKIIRTREEILNDYYASAEGTPEEIATRDQVSETAEKALSKEELPVKENTHKRKIAKKNDPLTITSDDWVEDEEGNFTRKEK